MKFVDFSVNFQQKHVFFQGNRVNWTITIMQDFIGFLNKQIVEETSIIMAESSWQSSEKHCIGKMHDNSTTVLITLA